MKRAASLATVLGLFLSVALVSGNPASAEDYVVDVGHSTVQFKIRHLLTKVTGKFKDFSGSISYDPNSAASSKVAFTVQAASIDTTNERRDKHLRSDDFFGVETHSTLSFESTSVKSKGEGELAVTGSFTMHGVTKEIEIPVTVNGVMQGPWGPVAGFETTFTVDRTEYGIEYNQAVEGGGLVLGHDVEIYISVEAVKPGS